VHGNDEAESTRFLPPEPAGPEPELAARPAEQPTAPLPPQPPPQPPQQTYGYPPPPPQQGYPPPGYAYPPPWAYQQQPPAPDNGQAVAGFVLSIVGIGLLVISAGLSSVVSVACSIVGIVCSRNGKRKVDAGETPKHRGLAQAGYIIGWVGLGLAILAIVLWALVFSFGDIETSSARSDAILARSWRIPMSSST
jgi:hypothetical protein